MTGPKTTEKEVIKHVEKHGRYFGSEILKYVVSWKGVTYSSDDTRDLVLKICEVEGIKNVIP